jgi:hypothetical protein
VLSSMLITVSPIASEKGKYCKSSSENYCNFCHFLWKFPIKIAPVTLHFSRNFSAENLYSSTSFLFLAQFSF